MNIYCPPSDGITPRCVIIANYGFYADQLEYTKIYAIQGMRDVSLECRRGSAAISTVCYEQNIENPTIFCTPDYSFDCSLVLNPSDNTDWYCSAGGNTVCNNGVIGNQTREPTGI